MYYKALATLAFAALVAGWAMRRRRTVHVPLVVTGIALDLVLVLILEFGRDVIGLAVHRSYSWSQWTHIGSSILAVLLYVPVVVLGVRLLRATVLLRGRTRGRTAHRRLATAALLARSIGFGFMWTV